MRNLWTSQRNGPEAGVTLVVVAVVMLVLLGFAALSIDLAYLTVSKDELRRAADSAALAGAGRLGNLDASATAVAFAAKNTVAGNDVTLGEGDVALGWYDFGTNQFAASGGTGEQNAVRLTARRTRNSPDGALPVFFASVLGIHCAELSAEAIGVIDRRVSGVEPGANSPLVPFLVSAETFGGLAQGLRTPIGTPVEFYPQRGDAPGNFGLANLDGGPNSTPELVDWIENGYPGGMEIPPEQGYLLVEGTPGFVDGIKNAVQDRMGDTVVVMVYDQVTDGGSNAIFRVRTFCAIKITGIHMTGQMDRRNIAGDVQEMRNSVIHASGTGMYNSTLSSLRLVQ